MTDLEPTTPQEYILKGVVNAVLGQEQGIVCIISSLQFMFLHRVWEIGATLFLTITLAFLGRFLPFLTSGNMNQHSTVPCNLLT